ncbi:MAG: acetyl-CoA carboxylase biotin carboxyl carrier protein [Kiloniellaceae bacterium]
MPKFQPDAELIRRLAALLEETGLSEIEYEATGKRIRVCRGAAGNRGEVARSDSADPAPNPAPAPAPTVEAVDDGDVVPPGAVISPMVGTVYVAAEPGGPPLVKVGDTVTEGQTLMIIEAMKVMNPLASPRAGTITRILIGDGQPVEFGEPLLVLE